MAAAPAPRNDLEPTRSRAPAPLTVLCVALAVAFAFPGLYLVWRNFTEDADPAGLLLSNRTMEPLLRTLRLAVATCISAAALGTALAWFSTRTDLPLRRLWRVVLPLPLVFPTFIGAAAFIRSLNPGGLAYDVLDTVGINDPPELRGLFGAWLVLTLFTYPYVYLPVAARLPPDAGITGRERPGTGRLGSGHIPPGRGSPGRRVDRRRDPARVSLHDL